MRPITATVSSRRRRESDLKGEEKQEAQKRNDEARLWISGLEAVNRKLAITACSTFRRRRSFFEDRLCRGHSVSWT